MLVKLAVRTYPVLQTATKKNRSGAPDPIPTREPQVSPTSPITPYASSVGLEIPLFTSGHLGAPKNGMPGYSNSLRSGTPLSPAKSLRHNLMTEKRLKTGAPVRCYQLL